MCEFEMNDVKKLFSKIESIEKQLGDINDKVTAVGVLVSDTKFVEADLNGDDKQFIAEFDKLGRPVGIVALDLYEKAANAGKVC